MANQLAQQTVEQLVLLKYRGWSNRRIARELGVDRGTVAKHIDPGRWTAVFTARRTGPASACEPLRKTILLKLKEGLSGQAIHEVLIAEYGFTAGYSSVRRFVRGIREIATPSDGISGPLAKEASQRSWMLKLFQGKMSAKDLHENSEDDAHIARLVNGISSGRLTDRHKAVVVLARRKGMTNSAIARFLGIRRETARRYYATYVANGPEGLFERKSRRQKKYDDPSYVDAVIATLHSPPSAHGINRTSWKQDDLKRVLAENGIVISKHGIRAIIRKAGYRWRKARKVLTSSDPNFRQKLARITAVLSDISPHERFFSIDEFGPFHITQKSGRRLIAPGQDYTIPQHQTSRGKLILTAALELCTNQVTHFYSDRKNTAEMIRLVDVLLEQYSGMEKLYLSWDAASWHMSKRFYEKVSHINCRSQIYRRCPRIEVAPLPASAQFLNVIESVFSGMARAIIHNSNYRSTDEAKTAIDRYFTERNVYFRANPKPAGNKIWGKERTPPVFSESNNCKDPAWR